MKQHERNSSSSSVTLAVPEAKAMNSWYYDILFLAVSSCVDTMGNKQRHGSQAGIMLLLNFNPGSFVMPSISQRHNHT